MAATRKFGLDLIRAFAITVVIHGHGYGYFEGVISFPVYFFFAIDGVTVFFVLSGFLIGGLLMKNPPEFPYVETLVRFWRRRWWRTLPNYFLVLSFLVSLEWWKGALNGGDYTGYFFFIQNLAWPHPNFFGEAWSLPVEEWFYLLVPLLFFILQYPRKLMRRSPDQDSRMLWLGMIMAVVVTSTTYRLATVMGHDGISIFEWDSSLRKQVVTRLDSLMYGVLGAYLYRYHPQVWGQQAKLWLCLGLLLLLVDRCFLLIWPSQLYLNFLALTLSPLAVLCCFPWLTALQCRSRLVVKVVTFISVISYALYLLHRSVVQAMLIPPIMAWVEPSLGHSPWLTYGLYWMVSLMAASLLFFYYERPMTAMRDRTWRFQ